MTLQATGDYAAAKQMIEELGVIRPPVQAVLDRLEHVPVDIAPRFVTAEELLREGGIAGLEPATSWVRSRFERLKALHVSSSLFTDSRDLQVLSAMTMEAPSRLFTLIRARAVSDLCHPLLAEFDNKGPLRKRWRPATWVICRLQCLRLQKPSTGRYEEIEALLEQSEAMESADDGANRIRALSLRAKILGRLGNSNEAERLVAEAVALSRKTGSPSFWATR